MADTLHKLTKEELSILLLIHGSYADLEFTEDEMDSIKSKFDINAFNKVRNIHDSLTDYQVLELVMAHKKEFFNTTQEKKALLDLLRNQFSADGEVTKLEANLVNFLERFM